MKNAFVRVALVVMSVLSVVLTVPSVEAGTISRDTTDWNSWDEVAGLPGGNLGYALASGTMGDFIYVVGGDGANQTNVMRFDGTTWASIVGLPVSKTRLAAAVHNGKLYAIAGNSGGSTNVYVFDGTTWAQVRGLPAAREWLGAGVLGTNMYAVAGGYTNVYRFGGTNVIWNQVRGLPVGRDKLAVATLSNKLYAIGGTTSTNVYAFNGTNWTAVAGLPQARQLLAAATFEGNIFAIGGDNAGAKTNVYRYNGSTWTEAPGLPSARAGLTAAVLSNKLYAIAGNSTTNVYRYPAGQFGSGVAPESGSYTGGYTVSIYGTGLSDGTSNDVTVTLCGVAASVVNVLGSTQIVVTAGAAPSWAIGAGDVQVVSISQGSSIKTNGFTYAGAPGMRATGIDGETIMSGAAVSQAAGTLFVPPFPVGAGPITNTFSLINSGAVELNISSATFSGAGAAQFAVSGVPATIGAGTAASNINVVFTPSTNWSYVATLDLANDSPTASYQINVRGMVYDAYPSSGPLAGGTEIWILDGHYGTVTNVTVGGEYAGIASGDLDWVIIEAPASETAGAKDIVIQTSDYGDFTLAGAFTYNPAGYINRYVEDWNSWQEVAALPSDGNQYFSSGNMAALNDALYLFGCGNSNVYRYDGTTWSIMATPHPLPNTYGSVVAMNGAIYAVGGTVQGSYVATNAFRFDGTNWTPVAGLSTGVWAAATGVLNDEFCVAGGSTMDYAITNVSAFNGTSWREMQALSQSNYMAPGAVLSNKMYVTGGFLQGDPFSAISNVVVFDGTNWAGGTALPEPRCLHGSVVFNDQLYVIGGFNQTLAGTFDSVYRLNGAEWSAAPSLPKSMGDISAAVYRDAIYVAGGANLTDTNVYRYPARTGSQGVIPSSGVRNGGYTVTISGSNLGNGSDITAVTLCGVSASNIVSQSSTQVVIVAGAAEASITGDVRIVSTSYGISVLTNGFAYVGTGKESQTIAFPAIANQTRSSIVRLAATASSGLPVTFSVVSGPATLTGGTNLSFSSEGAVSVKAAQAGNATYDPAPDVVRSFFVLGTFSFRATALTNSVVLRWSSPGTIGFSNQNVLVRCDTNAYPDTTADGSSVYTGTNQLYTHTGLISGQPYYYTVFYSHDGSSFTNPP